MTDTTNTSKTSSFVQIPTCVLFDDDLRAVDIRVYGAILAHTNVKDLSCWPSISRLATLTNLSERSVSSAIKTLAGKGLVSVKRRFNNSNTYEVKSLKSMEEIYGLAAFEHFPAEIEVCAVPVTEGRFPIEAQKTPSAPSNPSPASSKPTQQVIPAKQSTPKALAAPKSPAASQVNTKTATPAKQSNLEAPKPSQSQTTQVQSTKPVAIQTSKSTEPSLFDISKQRQPTQPVYIKINSNGLARVQKAMGTFQIANPGHKQTLNSLIQQAGQFVRIDDNQFVNWLNYFASRCMNLNGDCAEVFQATLMSPSSQVTKTL